MRKSKERFDFEQLRPCVSDLLRMLRSQHQHSQTAAAKFLWDMTYADKQYVAAQLAGLNALPKVAGVLASDCEPAADAAAEVVRNLSTVPACGRGTLDAAQLVASELVRVIRSGGSSSSGGGTTTSSRSRTSTSNSSSGTSSSNQTAALEAAAVALHRLSKHPSNAAAMIKTPGCLSALIKVKICGWHGFGYDAVQRRRHANWVDSTVERLTTVVFATLAPSLLLPCSR